MPETTPGTVLGHEAVGTIQEIGSAVTTVAAGDRVLLSCISACGRCRFCKEARYGQCLGGGGWIFGHLIDRLQAEYARVPFADASKTAALKVVLQGSESAHGLNGRVAAGALA